MYFEEKKYGAERLIIYSGLILIIALLLILLLKISENNSNQKNNLGNYVANKISTENEIRYNGSEKLEIENVEDAINTIVGISKLKDNGESIFINNAEEKLGLGSGVIITEDGYILSNQHVVGNKYSTCYITLDDGKTYDGTVMWADSNIDLAIVKINKKGLNYIKLGDSDSIKLIDEIYAIGNPLGMDFQRTITKGIISALNRTIKIEEENGNTYMEDLIQIDAIINKGNSGGALVNKNGELIGINSVKIGDAEGLGFAVPINIVKPIINKLVQNGKFEEAWLGIYGYDKEAVKYIDEKIEIESGIYVAQVDANSPLYQSEIKSNDIILEIDNVKINKMNDLKKYIYSKEPGDEVILTVKRAGNVFKQQIKLETKN